MYTDYKLVIEYETENSKRRATGSNAELEIKETHSENRITIAIDAKVPLTITNTYIEYDYPFSEDDKFFANGYQSWTDTKEYSRNERFPDRGFACKTAIGNRLGMQYSGDYTFVDYTRKNGEFHSHSYAYVNKGNTIDFIGSMTDRTGWTIIYASMNNNTLRVRKEVEGVTMNGEYTLFDLYVETGEYNAVFDNYFAAMAIKPLPTERMLGYTSWYNYYQDINEEVILRDLEALAESTDLINTFQIDDGYQAYIGEWLNVDKKKFPNGMKVIADAIHGHGLNAGIWLNPFGVQHDAPLFKENPDWFVKNKDGKAFMVGGNWGGFYALDLYNEEVRAYIRNCFDVVLNDWGFDMVKLDFLYAAAVLPRNGKSRGQIMFEAMDFIRECVGDKKILGCGVPMMPCFGKVEYMRIGADMTHQWKESFVRRFSHREDVSTVNAINNSVFRRHLNHRAFLCDPDVFLIRDYNINFSLEERRLLAKIIKIFGGVIFMSDDVNRYDEEQFAILKDTFSAEAATFKSIDIRDDIYTITYDESGQDKKLEFSIKTGERTM